MLNVFDFIFDQIQEDNQDREYLVYVSYLEIYKEEIKDLLAKDTSKRLQLKEGRDKGVYVNGLKKVLTAYLAQSCRFSLRSETAASGALLVLQCATLGNFRSVCRWWQRTRQRCSNSWHKAKSTDTQGQLQ